MYSGVGPVIMWSIFFKILTRDTLELAHEGELWGVFCEYKIWFMSCPSQFWIQYHVILDHVIYDGIQLYLMKYA